MEVHIFYIPLRFFAKFCAELAASVPRSEIVGKSEYFRFGMRDSLALEASFLEVIVLLDNKEILLVF